MSGILIFGCGSTSVSKSELTQNVHLAPSTQQAEQDRGSGEGRSFLHMSGVAEKLFSVPHLDKQCALDGNATLTTQSSDSK
jgi:hypothetical protein